MITIEQLSKRRKIHAADGSFITKKLMKLIENAEDKELALSFYQERFRTNEEATEAVLRYIRPSYKIPQRFNDLVSEFVLDKFVFQEWNGRNPKENYYIVVWLIVEEFISACLAEGIIKRKYK